MVKYNNHWSDMVKIKTGMKYRMLELLYGSIYWVSPRFISQTLSIVFQSVVDLLQEFVDLGLVDYKIDGNGSESVKLSGIGKSYFNML